MPQVHMIVPVYKVEKFLRRCVDSILAQTFPDWHLILVDDGSPDACPDICNAYARQDGRIQVIHQKNGGLSAARNTGIEEALSQEDCQWLTFVDSDDWLHPKFLEVLYGAVTETGCQMGACGLYRTCGEDFSREQDWQVRVMDGEDFYCTDMGEPVATVAWNKIYHRSLFSQLRYPVGKLHEDEFTTYRAVYQAGQVAFVPAKLYAYYQNPDSITGSGWSEKRMDMLEAFEEQATFAKTENHPRLLKKVAESYCYAAYDQLQQAGPEYGRQLRRRLRSALKLCRESGAFSGRFQPLWAYEQAYPCKIFWWLYGKMAKGEKQ